MFNEKYSKILKISIFLLGYRDSNSDRRLQRPACSTITLQPNIFIIARPVGFEPTSSEFGVQGFVAIKLRTHILKIRQYFLVLSFIVWILALKQLATLPSIKFPWKLSTPQCNIFLLLQFILTYSTKVRYGMREESRTLRINCGFYFLEFNMSKIKNFLTVTSKYELDMIISPPLKLSQDRFENLYPNPDSNRDPVKETF